MTVVARTIGGDALPGTTRAALVVGAPSSGDRAGAVEFAERTALQLQRSFPGRTSIVVALERRSTRVRAVVPDGSAQLLGSAEVEGEDEISTLLRAASSLESGAVALVQPRPDRDDDWLTHLLSPILDGGYDVVCPCDAHRAVEGAVHTGITSPLTRTLFGSRLRQPIGKEIAVSLDACHRLLADGTWLDEVARDGPDLWLASPSLTSGLRVCQSCLGPRPATPAAQGEPLVTALPRTVGVLFRGIERHASEWQRAPARTAVPSFGRCVWLEGGPAPVDVAPMIEAFRLGHRDLSDVWGGALSPATRLALQRAAALPGGAFELPDGVWAHALCEFLVSWHQRALNRAHLLAALTPLYLGWFATFARQVVDAPVEKVDERVDAIDAAFEEARRHLVAWWRWPDRFSP